MAKNIVSVVLTLSAILFALPASPQTQKSNKIPVVGYVTLASAQRENEKTFERGLRELGILNERTFQSNGDSLRAKSIDCHH